MITSDTDNAPDWVDLTTPDIESATRFYTELLGWDLERAPTPLGDYFIGKRHGHQVAGMVAVPPDHAGEPPVWTMFINVADVDETTHKVKRAGGHVHQPPLDIPDGRLAIVADPTGGVLGLIATPLKHSDEKWFSTECGAVCWVELSTRDPESAERFYVSAFDWRAETSDYSGITYTTFKLGDEEVAGMMAMPEEVPPEAPSHWAIYFSVEDCEEAERRVVELGGKVLRPTTDAGLGRSAVLEDPQGAPFQIMEYRAGRADPG